MADRFGRNPKLQGRKSASKIGSRTILAACWHDPVAHSRDTQRPLPAVGLGDLHPTHQRRPVDTRAEVTGKLAEHPLDPVGLHCLQSHTIDSGGTTICSHPPPRLHQDVIPIDPVIQSVETTTLGLLGRSP